MSQSEASREGAEAPLVFFPNAPRATTPAEALPKGWRVEVCVAVVAAVLCGGWLLVRLGPGVVFGEWSGVFLSSSHFYVAPIISSAFVQPILALPLGEAAWRLCASSALAGAMACGVVAAITTRLARRSFTSVEAFAGGLASAFMLASSPTFTYAATGGGPTTLTLALALGALLAVLGLLDSGHGSKWMVVGSCCSGLAAANHPAFGLVFFVMLGVHFAARQEGSGHSDAIRAVAVFLGLASLPFWNAMWRGEPLAYFLSHALASPFPVVAGGMPEWGYAADLLESVTPLLLLLAMPAMVLFFRETSRAFAIVLALLFWLTGPMLPFFTNQGGAPDVIQDLDAPRLLAVAVVSVFAATGCLLLARAISKAPRSRPHRLALVLGLVLLVVALQGQRASDRRHSFALELGREALKDCPENGIVVAGNASLTSLLMACQASVAIRPDVLVVPYDFLPHPRLRAKLRAYAGVRASVPMGFPEDDAEERWQKEHPRLVAKLHDKTAGLRSDDQELTELALWEFVRDNPIRWPLCFLGVDASWLAARAQVCGAVLTYPRRPETVSSELEEVVQRVYAQDAYRSDPGTRDALTMVLLPVSEVSRCQGHGEDAMAVADLVSKINPESPEAHLAKSRAAALMGDREEAARYASSYMSLSQGKLEAGDAVTAAIQVEIQTGALRKQFEKIVAEGKAGAKTFPTRNAVAAQLWAQDDLFVLAKGYRELSESDPNDVDALYQYAAAMAQLGHLADAQTLLAKAAKMNPIAVGQRLQEDYGRFALLIIYHADQKSRTPS